MLMQRLPQLAARTGGRQACGKGRWGASRRAEHAAIRVHPNPPSQPNSPSRRAAASPPVDRRL
jgi:hypothetical protein